MKHFLLVLLSPFLLIGQNYTQEFERLFEAKNYDQAVQKLEAYLVETPQDLELLELQLFPEVIQQAACIMVVN